METIEMMKAIEESVLIGIFLIIMISAFIRANKLYEEDKKIELENKKKIGKILEIKTEQQKEELLKEIRRNNDKKGLPQH